MFKTITIIAIAMFTCLTSCQKKKADVAAWVPFEEQVREHFGEDCSIVEMLISLEPNKYAQKILLVRTSYGPGDLVVFMTWDFDNQRMAMSTLGVSDLVRQQGFLAIGQ